MSHRDQIRFVAPVRQAMTHYFTQQRVVEVGSLDINGSVRRAFIDCNYIGLDVGAGPGVDLVVPGQDYDAPDGSHDVAISCECMEHNPEWKSATANMLRLLRPNGLLIIPCAVPGRAVHETSTSQPHASPLTLTKSRFLPQPRWCKYFRSVPGLFESLAPAQDWVNWAAYDYYLVGIEQRRSR